jgi:16S rRNA (uracil1498-N3)-methyltransferase
VSTIVVTPIEFDGSEIELHGDAYHHLFRVKRLKAGESVRVVDGEGRARRGVVARVDRARGVVALGSAEPPREPAVRVELLVAPPEPNRAAWMVEKATEVGIVAIHFVATDRAARDERVFGAHQLARLHRIAVAAVQQCGRSLVPEVTGVHALRDALDVRRNEADSILVLEPGARPVSGLLAGLTASPRRSILIGPEGGWSEAELALFRDEGYLLGSLGDRVLRVETAAVVIAALAVATGEALR